MKFYGGPFQESLYHLLENEMPFLFDKNPVIPYILCGIRKCVILVWQWECSENSTLHIKGINSEIQLIWQLPTPKFLCIRKPHNSWYYYKMSLGVSKIEKLLMKDDIYFYLFIKNKFIQNNNILHLCSYHLCAYIYIYV